MAPRNGVKKQIAREFCSYFSNSLQKRRTTAQVTRSTAATMVSLGANSSLLRERSVITATAADAATMDFAGGNSSSLPERSVTTAGVLRTGSSMTPAERPVVQSTGYVTKWLLWRSAYLHHCETIIYGIKVTILVALAIVGIPAFTLKRSDIQKWIQTLKGLTGILLGSAGNFGFGTFRAKDRKGILSPSLAAGVDKSLDAGPALTRSNPTAAILVKVPSADFLKYEGSRLYKDEKGDWVADLVPENTAESDAYSTTEMMEDKIDRPTPIMV